MELAERLKLARGLRHLTQEQVAAMVGIPRSTYAGYEAPSKQCEPDIQMLAKLAAVLNVDLDWLAGKTELPRKVREFMASQVQEGTSPYEAVTPEALMIAAELVNMGFPMNRKEELLRYARFIAEQVKQHTPNDKLDK